MNKSEIIKLIKQHYSSGGPVCRYCNLQCWDIIHATGLGCFARNTELKMGLPDVFGILSTRGVLWKSYNGIGWREGVKAQPYNDIFLDIGKSIDGKYFYGIDVGRVTYLRIKSDRYYDCEQEAKEACEKEFFDLQLVDVHKLNLLYPIDIDNNYEKSFKPLEEGLDKESKIKTAIDNIYSLDKKGQYPKQNIKKVRKRKCSVKRV